MRVAAYLGEEEWRDQAPLWASTCLFCKARGFREARWYPRPPSPMLRTGEGQRKTGSRGKPSTRQTPLHPGVASLPWMKPRGLLGSETGFGEGVGGSLSPRRAAASPLVSAKPLTHPHGSKRSLDLWPGAGKETWVCTRDLPGNQMQHLRGTLREGSAGRAQPPAQDATSFPPSSPEQLQGRPGPTAACPGSVPAGTSLVQLNTQHRTRGRQLRSRHP